MGFSGMMSRSRLSPQIPLEEADVHAHSHSCEAVANPHLALNILRSNVLAQKELQLSAPPPWGALWGCKQPRLSLVSWVLGAEAGQASQGIYCQMVNRRAAGPPS